MCLYVRVRLSKGIIQPSESEKIMKKSILLGLSLTAVLATSGCAVAVHSQPYYPYPPVVVVGAPDVVVLDYWYDGSVYYYFDADLGFYFWYDGFGVRQYCGRGWLPNAGWHRHDGGWSHDAGWGRGHDGGARFPGEGHGRGNGGGRGDGGRGNGGGRPGGHGGGHRGR
jgi:hypothetical protein